ncbi:MAG: hypothetical protein JWM28_469 [Chitinophagaceae bacterium]|nr:hypothetical protein [Chitinophagaceae bacterium]
MLTLIIVPATMLKAQNVKKDSLLNDLLTSKHYVFDAESVLPSNGRLRLLNSGERVEVNGDSLTTDLPYFGRAYSAPIDPSQGGFHFTSTDFEYTVKEKKKDGWSVFIKPKDNQDVQQLTLDVSSKGMATLQVISNNRQYISFNGRIKERKKK